MAIIFGKIVYWFLYNGLDSAYKYISAGKETRADIESILNSLKNNKKFCEEAAKLIDPNNGITDTVASNIIKLSVIQKKIEEKLEKNKFVEKTDLENGIKEVIINAWNNENIVGSAVNKVKKQIK
jgi:hypothetical protein